MKNRSIKTAKAFAILALVFFLASCLGPEKKVIPKSYTVEIKAMQFQPAELSVQKGDTVLFVNQDMLVHNVTEEKAKAWGSPSLATGESYKMVVNESSDYYCSLHPVMKGKLVVQ
ncbi:MAG TPA: plastocyanin/azurin family copper-binding protein [Flavisolibacter sp.]|jgi:plastocyanin|nr:plastocyanin/azurin family copper-binding protein [Flavisolibacter sp.]